MTGKKRIGLLLFETAGQRLYGDPGYPGTFPFPVEYGLVPGSYRDLVVGSEQAKERLCRAAVDLCGRGVTGIAGDCGLMALYQEAIASSVRVPVLASALSLIPLLLPMIGTDRRLGIITGHSGLLGERHLCGAGAVPRDRLAIAGMEGEPHFSEVVLAGAAVPRYTLMRRDVIHALDRLLFDHPDVGAILLECSNLTVFGREVSDACGLPVFDMNTAMQLLWNTVEKTNYSTALFEMKNEQQIQYFTGGNDDAFSGVRDLATEKGH